MTAPRAFRALLRHDIMMMLRSVYLMYLLLPLAAGLLLRAWLAGGDDDRLGVAFTLLLTVLFAIAMAGRCRACICWSRSVSAAVARRWREPGSPPRR